MGRQSMMIKWYTNEQKWFCLRAMVSKSAVLTFTYRNAPESYWELPDLFSTTNLVSSILVEGTTFVFHFCRNINAYWVPHFPFALLSCRVRSLLNAPHLISTSIVACFILTGRPVFRLHVCHRHFDPQVLFPPLFDPRGVDNICNLLSD